MKIKVSSKNQSFKIPFEKSLINVISSEATNSRGPIEASSWQILKTSSMQQRNKNSRKKFQEKCLKNNTYFIEKS